MICKLSFLVVVSLAMEVRSFCEPNYYGPQCTVPCTLPSGREINYECDPATGKRRCRAGKILNIVLFLRFLTIIVVQNMQLLLIG
jgi:Delta serrate ligand